MGPLGEETVAGHLGEDDDVTDEVDGSAPTPATSAYDFLFGETSYRTVEDAAVRSTEEQNDSASAPLEEHTVVAADLAKLRADRRAGRGRAVELPAPRVKFYVELSTGGRELLDQPLVIGRAPSASALGGGIMPRLITMTTINQDISRTHARIAVEGETVVVTDLHSRNGTLVTMPGRPAQKIREGEPTVIIPGTIVDLGDGATLTVQEG
ncbi:MAG: FHA domain-containing protein [Kineosporiaceae bacterium]|nr:FHA domain-containing protein [Aeromicrobium sp.]